jgi:TatD DNase family protein
MRSFLVDSHCHLNYDGLRERLENVVSNAENANVKILQTICTKMSEVESLQNIANQYQHVFYSIGVHPLNVHEEELVSIETLVELTKSDKKISAFGETGLDYYKSSSDEHLVMQRQNFINHIKASQITALPLVIHTREAENDTYKILNEQMKKQKFSGVLHCFTGSYDLAQKAVDLGLYISASGIITFKNAEVIRNVFKNIPIEKILIETDSPFLAPVPYRGKTNEP